MSKRILAVDDSRTILESIRISLLAKGYSVDTALGGDQALSLLGSNSYDMVFTDFNMPEIDGPMLVKKIRRLPTDQSKVPVVMVTTETDNKKKIKGKIAGVSGWIVKPFKVDELVEAINKATS